jgi:FKBP-type peptidyl-prolyl cis-trans isomerase FkpA
MRLKSVLTLSFVLATITALTIACNMGEYSGFKKTKSGVYYKIYTENNNDTTVVRKGTFVSVSLKYGLKDSTLFDSRMSPEPVVIPVSDAQYEGDFYDCLKMLRQGDSATFILKAGPLFTKTFRQPKVPPFMTDESDIYFDIKVYKVQTQEQMSKEKEIRNMELEKKEMLDLEAYIKTNNITVKPTESGIYYLETKKGTGKAPVKDGYISAQYTVSLLSGDKLFSTLDKGEPVEFKYGSPYENEGFMEVIGMMREGGKANAIVPSSKAFGAKGAGKMVPPFSTLYYDIELIKVMSKEEFDANQAKKQAMKKVETEQKDKEEAAAIEKYLKDNHITPTKRMPDGLIYVEKQAGSGPKAMDGKNVKVNYTGKLIDGTVFDASKEGQPLEFAIGRKQVIAGWDEGISLMNTGGKAMLIIPSKLGYKERGTGGGKIPPYATLIFDVELVDAEK